MKKKEEEKVSRFYNIDRVDSGNMENTEKDYTKSYGKLTTNMK